MVDPLSLLRQYTVNQKEVVEFDDYIIFGEFAWPKDAKTNYLISRPKKEHSIKEYYTLESLIFFLKCRYLVHPEYCGLAAAADIPAVRRPDRKQVLNYLTGVTDTSPSIDSSASLETPTQSVQVKRSRVDEGGAPAAKKPRVNEDLVQEREARARLAAPLDHVKEEVVTIDNDRVKEEVVTVDNDSVKEEVVTIDNDRVKEEVVTINNNHVKEEVVTVDNNE